MEKEAVSPGNLTKQTPKKGEKDTLDKSYANGVGETVQLTNVTLGKNAGGVAANVWVGGEKLGDLLTARARDVSITAEPERAGARK